MNKINSESIKKALKKHFVSTIIITMLSIICWFIIELYSMQKTYIDNAATEQKEFRIMYLDMMILLKVHDISLASVTEKVKTVDSNYVMLKEQIEETQKIAKRNAELLGYITYN